MRDAHYQDWSLSAPRPNAMAALGGLVLVVLIGAGVWTALAWFGRAFLETLH